MKAIGGLAESIQRTMGSEESEYFTLNHFENAGVYFHRNLTKVLAESVDADRA